MKLLAKLCTTPGVPGREDRIRAIIEKEIKPHVDSLRTDPMGNLIALRKPRPAGKKKPKKNPTRVMLAAHMDQIGFLVSHVEEAGWVRVDAVGGFDPRNLFARNCIVCTTSGAGDLPGVLNPGTKPIHIASDEDKKKIPDLADFYIDLGLPADEVKQKVKIGDMVTLTAPFIECGGNVVSQCLDNRIGCWAVIEALKKLKNHDCEIHAVWTVQEEVGLRGAGPAAFGVEPDIGLSCDTTLCCDVPSVPDHQRCTKLGAGVALKVKDGSTITDISLLQELEAVANKKKITYQRSALSRGGQDGAMLQRAKSGCKVAVFACPVRYIHTTTETASKSDIESYRDLLVAYLGSVG